MTSALGDSRVVICSPHPENLMLPTVPRPPLPTPELLSLPGQRSERDACPAPASSCLTHCSAPGNLASRRDPQKLF